MDWSIVIVIATYLYCSVKVQYMIYSNVLVFVGRVKPVVAEFNSGWRQGVAALQGDSMRACSNLQRGTLLLQRALATLVQEHRSLTQLLARPPFAANREVQQARDSLINAQQLIVEIKKFKLAF